MDSAAHLVAHNKTIYVELLFANWAIPGVSLRKTFLNSLICLILSIDDRERKREQKSHELKTELLHCCLSAQDEYQVTSVNLKNRADKEIRDDKLDSLGRSSAEPLNSVSTADRS